MPDPRPQTPDPRPQTLDRAWPVHPFAPSPACLQVGLSVDQFLELWNFRHKLLRRLPEKQRDLQYRKASLFRNNNNHGVRPSHPIIFMATLYTFIIIMASAL